MFHFVWGWGLLVSCHGAEVALDWIRLVHRGLVAADQVT